MKVYKLTNQYFQTHGGFQWRLGEPKEASGERDLCGPGWLHFYHHPLLAVLLNPVHADIKRPRLFEAEAEGDFRNDRGLKGGATRLTLVKELPLPTITPEQRVKFAVLCAKEVCQCPKFHAWADGWLSGTDRSMEAAAAEAESAAWAAEAAARAAEEAAAADAAEAAARAAWAAEKAAAADAAWADAAARAADAAKPLDLVKLAEEAIQ